MATGDFMNNLKKLKVELKRVKYPSELILTQLQSGQCEAYTPVLKYIFVDYNKTLVQDVENIGLDPVVIGELAEGNTLRFIEVAYRILRDLFGYKPALNRDQFVHSGFAERKVMICTEIVQLVRKRYGGRAAVKPLKVSIQNTNNVTEAARPFAGLKICPLSPLKKRDDVSAVEEVGAIGGQPEMFNAGDVSFEVYSGFALGPRTSSPSGSITNRFPKLDEPVKPVNGVDNVTTSKPFYTHAEVRALLHQKEMEYEKKIQAIRSEVHNGLQLETISTNDMNMISNVAADFIHGDEGIE